MDEENPIKFRMFRVPGAGERNRAALVNGQPPTDHPLNDAGFCRHAGDVMWAARTEAGMSVDELAKKAGVRPAEVSNMEGGLLCPHDISFILRIATVFGRSVSYEIEEMPK